MAGLSGHALYLIFLTQIIMLDPFIILAAAENAEGLVGKFGIDWTLIVAQAINFLIVAFVLWKFAFKPVIATMDERREKIEKGLQFAEDAKKELADAEKRQEEILREANKESQRILKEARDKATEYQEKMKNETAEQIEEMRRRADEANELERQRILSEVRQEIARLVVLTSGKVLARELGDAEKKRLNASAAEEIGKLN